MLWKIGYRWFLLSHFLNKFINNFLISCMLLLEQLMGNNIASGAPTLQIANSSLIPVSPEMISDCRARNKF